VVSVAGVISALLQIALVAVGSPLLVGVMRQIRARMEGRAGAGVLQPWRDLRKLARKQPMTPRGTSEVFRTAPLLMLATTVAVVAVAPFVTIAAVPAAGTDLFVVVALLTLGAAALALAGLDTGTAFGGMGASREITILALVEPTLLVAIFALSVPVGSTNLADIVTSILHDPSRAITPANLLAGVALALAELASAMRLSVFLGLWATLFAPWGIAADAGIGALALGALIFTIKVTALGAALAAGEVFLAKLRLFRVPELLAGSFVLALLAVVASFFFG
jgi:formate hydrogenlyase subunit 4